MSQDQDSTGALAALKAEVAEGWKVKIADHDYLGDSRDDVTVTAVTEDGLVLTPKRPWASQGRSFRTMNFTWSGTREVTGRTVRLYTVGTSITSRSTPGVRRLVKTFTFSPPREY